MEAVAAAVTVETATRLLRQALSAAGASDLVTAAHPALRRCFTEKVEEEEEEEVVRRRLRVALSHDGPWNGRTAASAAAEVAEIGGR